jgi:arabinose-5-phosphate isomerase
MESDELVGIITDGDIRRMLSKTPEIAAIKASDIMGTKPKKIAFDAMAIDALNTMEANNISQILVVNDKKKYVGVIHIHDLIKEGIF